MNIYDVDCRCIIFGVSKNEAIELKKWIFIKCKKFIMYFIQAE